jgi:transposase
MTKITQNGACETPGVETGSLASLSQSVNNITPTAGMADPQVKVKPVQKRRFFNDAYKTRMLAAFDECPDSKARSAFLRREGLYYARIADWRNKFATDSLKKENKNNKKARIDHLTQEVAQLQKKLAQAEAIIDLQKKVSDLFGALTLSHAQKGVN